MELVKT